VFKAHRLLYHSTSGLRVVKKKKKDLRDIGGLEGVEDGPGREQILRCQRACFRACGLGFGLWGVVL